MLSTTLKRVVPVVDKPKNMYAACMYIDKNYPIHCVQLFEILLMWQQEVCGALVGL